MSDPFRDRTFAQFPTPVLWRQHNDLAALNGSLAALVRGLRDTEPNAAPGSSTRGGYQTDTNFLYRKEPPVASLQQLLYQGVQAYLPRFFQDVLLKPPKSVDARLWGWAVIMRPGDYNAPHVHPDAHVSGVYYVEVPDLSAADPGEAEPGGSLVFLDPRSSANMFHIRDRRHTESYVPVAGSLLLFPSYHMHAVFPYRGAGERISVAFNARLTLT
jgi:uncharacterized protein (TIGR02466 family)